MILRATRRRTNPRLCIENGSSIDGESRRERRFSQVASASIAGEPLRCFDLGAIGKAYNRAVRRNGAPFTYRAEKSGAEGRFACSYCPFGHIGGYRCSPSTRPSRSLFEKIGPQCILIESATLEKPYRLVTSC